MKALIAWMARHPVAANLLMGLILIAGVVNMLTMKQEVFPLIELDVLEVRVEYQGAAPDEVEEAIVQRIEEQIEGIDGIDQVTSVAVQGTGVVRIELARGVHVAAKLDEVKAAIDRITTFPDEAERPEVRQLVTRQRVVELALYGDAPESVLRQTLSGVKPMNDTVTLLWSLGSITMRETQRLGSAVGLLSTLVQVGETAVPLVV